MIILASFIIAFIMILAVPQNSSAHKFTEFVKHDLLVTSKYGVNCHYFLSDRNALFDHPREYIAGSNIRSMSSYYCQTSGAPYKKSYEEYDEAGYITRSFDFDPDGSVAQMTVYKYAGDHKILETVEYTPAGNIDSRKCYKYDDSGAISEFASFGLYDNPTYKIEFFRGENVMREIEWSAVRGKAEESIYKYSNGRLAEKIFHSDKDGKIRQVYNYDLQGRLMSIVTFDAENVESEIYRWDYKYNGNDLPVEMAFSEPRAASTIKRTLLYDKDGELISLESRTSSPELNMYSLQRFEREEQGNWAFKLYDGEGAARPSEIIRYDGNDCNLETVVYSSDGGVANVVKYKYSAVHTETPPADPAAFATEANIKKECVRNLKTLECAISVYEMETGGEFPDSLDKLVEIAEIEQVPRCPAGGKYSYAKIDMSEYAGTPYFRLDVKCSVHGGLFQP